MDPLTERLALVSDIEQKWRFGSLLYQQLLTSRVFLSGSADGDAQLSASLTRLSTYSPSLFDDPSAAAVEAHRPSSSSDAPVPPHTASQIALHPHGSSSASTTVGPQRHETRAVAASTLSRAGVLLSLTSRLCAALPFSSGRSILPHFVLPPGDSLHRDHFDAILEREAGLLFLYCVHLQSLALTVTAQVRRYHELPSFSSSSSSSSLGLVEPMTSGVLQIGPAPPSVTRSVAIMPPTAAPLASAVAPTRQQDEARPNHSERPSTAAPDPPQSRFVMLVAPPTTTTLISSSSYLSATTTTISELSIGPPSPTTIRSSHGAASTITTLGCRDEGAALPSTISSSSNRGAPGPASQLTIGHDPLLAHPSGQNTLPNRIENEPTIRTTNDTTIISTSFHQALFPIPQPVEPPIVAREQPVVAAPPAVPPIVAREQPVVAAPPVVPPIVAREQPVVAPPPAVPPIVAREQPVVAPPPAVPPIVVREQPVVASPPPAVPPLVPNVVDAESRHPTEKRAIGSFRSVYAECSNDRDGDHHADALRRHIFLWSVVQKAISNVLLWRRNQKEFTLVFWCECGSAVEVGQGLQRACQQHLTGEGSEVTVCESVEQWMTWLAAAQVPEAARESTNENSLQSSGVERYFRIAIAVVEENTKGMWRSASREQRGIDCVAWLHDSNKKNGSAGMGPSPFANLPEDRVLRVEVS